MKNAWCGKTRTLQNGTITITFNNASRKYILRVPDGYDSSIAYRLVLAYAWSGASASQVVSTNYFTFATQDSKNTIFAAPDHAAASLLRPHSCPDTESAVSAPAACAFHIRAWTDPVETLGFPDLAWPHVSGT